jgi:hypothetical protein
MRCPGMIDNKIYLYIISHSLWCLYQRMDVELNLMWIHRQIMHSVKVIFDICLRGKWLNKQSTLFFKTGKFNEEVGSFVKCYFRAPLSSVQRSPWRTSAQSSGRFFSFIYFYIYNISVSDSASSLLFSPSLLHPFT